jgi:hypothetical protein
MNRKEGYYWVKLNSRWVIAYYTGIMDLWDVPKYAIFKGDSTFDEINETQILPPNN